MRIEDADWKPTRELLRRTASQSVLALRALQVGDIKRIIHDDLTCNVNLKREPGSRYHVTCSLATEVIRLRRRLGWKVEYYHEKTGVLVIRRLG